DGLVGGQLLHLEVFGRAPYRAARARQLGRHQRDVGPVEGELAATLGVVRRGARARLVGLAAAGQALPRRARCPRSMRSSMMSLASSKRSVSDGASRSGCLVAGGTRMLAQRNEAW